MITRRKSLLLSLSALGTVLAFSAAKSQQVAASVAPRVVKSQQHDSAGDTVYETKGDATDAEAIEGFVMPKITQHVEPKFTRTMKAKRGAGLVLVSTVITAKGDTIDTAALRCTLPEKACPDADASAIEAVRQYRFQPASIHGEPVAFRCRIEVNYQIW